MLKQHKKAHHQIRLNREFRSDILWWTNLIAPWNGVSYLFAGPTSEFASDASGSWGCGAHTTESWFQMQWNEQSLPLTITIAADYVHGSCVGQALAGPESALPLR